MTTSNDHYFDSFAFDEAKFDQLLNGKQSQNLLYLQALLCPCRDRSTGAPTSSCVRCRGLGYTYSLPETMDYHEVFYYGSSTRSPKLQYSHSTSFDLIEVKDDNDTTYPGTHVQDGILVFDSDHPAQGQMFTVSYRSPMCMRALVTNVSSQRPVRQDMGFTEQGGFSLTFPYMTRLPGERGMVANPAFYCSEPDRFVLLDSRLVRQDVLYKGETDLLLYGFVFEALECYSVDPEGCKTVYSLGSDYVLEQSKVIWLRDRLAPGRPYAVRYLAAPEYYVHSEQPQVRHHGQKPLPRRVSVKLWSTHPRFETAGRTLS